MSSYQNAYQRLLAAIQKGHDNQIPLLAAMEEAYAFLDENEEQLSDEEFLSLRILLKQGETMAGRYFGM
ncbi:MAG TPA: hypothetical protein DD435_02740 [Cyanobacteria bacterium UBA8530]|nr:hypothetical protein [Cyanobacteria bacterium UBA8530]